jgi:HK97 family phage prohead protease
MSKPEIESRSTPRPVELRAAGSRRVGGLGAVYGKMSRPLGGGQFLEVIEPRAWSRSAGMGWPNVAAYREHNPSLLLGTVAARTLEIRDTKEGLDYTISLAETSAGNDTLADVMAGNLRGASVSMKVHEDDFTYNGSGLPIRHVISSELVELSVVSNPAYLDATCALRSYATFLGVDPDELVADALAGGDLLRYSRRTDNVQSAPGLVEVRSNMQPAQGLSTSEARRQLEELKPQPLSNRHRQLELLQVRGAWDAPTLSVAEARAQLHETRSWSQYDPRA